MAQTLHKPTEAAVDAGERVLAEVLGPQPLSQPDGYWRALAEAVLEAGDAATCVHPADLLARGDANDAEIRASVGATLQLGAREGFLDVFAIGGVAAFADAGFHWHGGANGVGSCEDGADCRCQAFRLDRVASRDARFELALGGGRR